MKISVLVPAFNSEKYIKQCLETICCQKRSKNYTLELFVIDNSSTDKTCEIIEKVRSEHDFTFIKDVPNIYKNSCQEAIEIFFEKLTGDWFTLVHSDDYIDENYFETSVKIIKKIEKQNVVVFQTIMKAFQEDGNTSYLFHEYKNLEEFKKIFIQKCPVNAPSVFYSKTVMDKIEFDNGTLNGAGDYKIWGDFASEGIYVYPIPFFTGYNYRFHQQQCTWQVLSNKKENEENLNNLKEFFRRKWAYE